MVLLLIERKKFRGLGIGTRRDSLNSHALAVLAERLRDYLYVRCYTCCCYMFVNGGQRAAAVQACVIAGLSTEDSTLGLCRLCILTCTQRWAEPGCMFADCCVLYYLYVTCCSGPLSSETGTWGLWFVYGLWPIKRVMARWACFDSIPGGTRFRLHTERVYTLYPFLFAALDANMCSLPADSPVDPY